MIGFFSIGRQCEYRGCNINYNARLHLELVAVDLEFLHGSNRIGEFGGVIDNPSIKAGILLPSCGRLYSIPDNG